jgi:hypothetical protein
MVKLLKADCSRRVVLEGAGAVPRPVDIDQGQTGFETLRTLRIYQFEPPAVIEGHAEEDEVFMVLLAGTADLVIRSDCWSNSQEHFNLSAASGSDAAGCAAYLPPGAEYILTPRSGADVAYVRATPRQRLPPAILLSNFRENEKGVRLLLEDISHAERLRLRLVQIDAGTRAVCFGPKPGVDTMRESLIHVRTRPATGGAGSMWLESWDTCAVSADENAGLRIAAGSSVVCLWVSAQ